MNAGRTPQPDPSRAVRRKVTVVLVVKLLAVLALFLAFFGPSRRPDVDADAVRDRLVTPAAPAGDGDVR